MRIFGLVGEIFWPLWCGWLFWLTWSWHFVPHGAPELPYGTFVAVVAAYIIWRVPVYKTNHEMIVDYECYGRSMLIAYITSLLFFIWILLFS